MSKPIVTLALDLENVVSLADENPSEVPVWVGPVEVYVVTHDSMGNDIVWTFYAGAECNEIKVEGIFE